MNGTGKNTISGIKGVIDMNVKVFKSNDKSVNQTYILVEGVVSGIDIVESAAYDATLDQLASLKDQVKQLEDDKKVLQDENNKMREQMQEATKNVMEVSLKLVNEAELNKQLAKSKAEAKVYKEQLLEKENFNNELLIKFGALLDRYEIVKRALYVNGFFDGAYLRDTKVTKLKFKDSCKKLRNDVADFPVLLEAIFTDLSKLIKSNNELQN